MEFYLLRAVDHRQIGIVFYFDIFLFPLLLRKLVYKGDTFIHAVCGGYY